MAATKKIFDTSLADITSNDGVAVEGTIDEKLTPDLALRRTFQNILQIIADEMKLVKFVFLGQSASSVSEMEEKHLKRLEYVKLIFWILITWCKSVEIR